jgi:dTDP-glucose pyrophosphorylase/CBS domain-containing protein
MSEEQYKRFAKAMVSPGMSISAGVKLLDQSGHGVLLVCGAEDRLIGVVTDGDIRRALLQGVPFDREIASICNRTPLVARKGVTRSEALHLIDTGRGFIVNQLPVVDHAGKLAGLILRSDLTGEETLPLSAVIMAGGGGTRLRPLTENVPKPMLTVGGKPILEHIIGQLRGAGIRSITIATHYLGEQISGYFGDGRKFGVRIDYLAEEKPMGTGGALGLVNFTGETLLVMNGDILTQVNFRAMLDFHREHGADLTMGTRLYEFQVPFGVVECDDVAIRSLVEKPVQAFFVNAGIYFVQKPVLSRIPKEISYNMTDLIQRLLAEGSKVVSFPIREYWLDIGRMSDYSSVAMEYGSSRDDGSKE